MKKIIDFFACMLQDNCIYSIKKFLVYVFSTLTIYLCVFTTKDYYELLFFIGLLLGLRTYERLKQSSTDNKG
jgi:hypothetical protein